MLYIIFLSDLSGYAQRHDCLRRGGAVSDTLSPSVACYPAMAPVCTLFDLPETCSPLFLKGQLQRRLRHRPTTAPVEAPHPHNILIHGPQAAPLHLSSTLSYPSLARIPLVVASPSSCPPPRPYKPQPAPPQPL
ncbi:hypothetical protein KL925_003571 [Ogataea polymorpha]|nr:hypothetical protein KL907_003961 [Ogataea polymorpha]KAG7926521.1 hypothetical protein KL925_003571 [Ogataea polymorpha]